MEAKNISQGIIDAILKLGLISLGIFLLLELKVLLVYIIVAAIISLIGRPIVLFLKNKLKFNNLLAASTSLLLLIGVLFGFISLFIPLVIQQSENLSLLNQDELGYKLDKLTDSETGVGIRQLAKENPKGLSKMLLDLSQESWI